MTEERALLDLAAQLKSAKKQARVKGLRSALTLVETASIAAHLTQCGRKQKIGTCWDVLFSHVQEAVITEIERGGCSGILLREMAELLTGIVQKANGLIKAKTLVKAILSAFETESHLPDNLVQVYFDLAANHLMEMPKYRAQLKSENWTELVNLCMKQYDKPLPGVTSLKFLELLHKVVTAGVCYSLTIETFVELLPFFTNILLCDRLHPYPSRFKWCLLSAVNVTLLALVADARYQVAKFTENVIETVMRMYKSGDEDNKLVFTTLEIAVKVHHPDGVGFDDPLFCAYNQDKWKEILNEILQLCEREVCELLRAGDTSSILNEFMTLFVHISHVMSQIVRLTPHELTPDEEIDYTAMTNTARKRKSVDNLIKPTQKRAKLVSENKSLANILTETSNTDYWFWLRYLATILEFYPSAVDKDYVKVARLICKLMPDVNNSSMNSFVKCSHLLLNHNLKNEVRSSWTSCYDFIVRSLSNDKSDERQKMLQILLSNGVVTNSSALLNEYLTNNVECTAESMRTLIVLIQGAVISEENRCVLLRWGLEGFYAEPAVTADLVLALLFKDVTVFTKPTKPKIDLTDIYRELTLNKEAVSDNNPIEKTQPKSIYPKLFGIFLDLFETASSQSSYDDYESLAESSKKLELILLVLSNVWHIENLQTKLLTITRPLFSQFIVSCQNELSLKKPFRIQMVNHIFSLNLNPSLAKLIREPDFTSNEFTDTLVNLFPTSPPPGQPKLLSIHEYSGKFTAMICSLKQPDIEAIFIRDISEKLKYRFQILELLCQIGNVDRLMKLIDEINCDPGNYNLRVHLQVLYTVAGLITASHDVEKCLRVLHSILTVRPADNMIFNSCLVILRNFIPAIENYGNYATFDLFVTIMEFIWMGLKKRKGQIVNLQSAYLEILSTICNFSKLAARHWESKDTRIVNDVFNYVNSQSVFVRLTAARAVGKVLSWDSSREILKRLHSQLASPPTCRDDYDRMAVASSSLMALAYAFQASSNSRMMVAHAILDLINSQNYHYELVENFINLLSRLLNVEDATKYFQRHLMDLLEQWLERGNNLNNFPYPTVGSKNITNFYSDFLEVIGATCFMLNKMDNLNVVVSTLNTTMSSICESALLLVYCKTQGQLPAQFCEWVSPERQEVICNQQTGRAVYLILRQNIEDQSLSEVIECARAVQQTLLLFEEDLVDSITEEDVLESLNNYSNFVKKLVDATKINGNDNVNLFVLRDTISVILRFLSNDHSRKNLAIACNLIRHIIDSYAYSLKPEIINLIPGIVNVLVSVSTKPNTQPAVYLLKYLIVEKKEEFSEALARLDPFPDNEEFNNFVNNDEVSLREEMRRFTQIVGYKGRRVGGLVRLLRSLETNKQDLRGIYEKAWAAQGIPDDTLLHDVIQKLVELCSHKDEAVRIEASKCLGELGPTDLNTLILKREECENSQYVPVIHRLIDEAIALLSQIIQTESLLVKKIACKALCVVMRFDGGSSQCSRFCAMFTTQQSNLSELNFFPKSQFGPPFNVWLPASPTSHDKWAQELTSALLATIGDDEGVSELLQELCLVHAPFAHQMLPLFLGVVIEVGHSSLVENITQSINDFFANYISNASKIEQKSIRALVEAVDYLRRWNFRQNKYEASLDGEKSTMALDLLSVAEAAGNCGAHFTSMMYAELWYEDQKSAEYLEQPDALSLSIDDLHNRIDALSRIMRNGFANVGVLDGLHGCGLSHLADPAERVTHLEQIGRWDMSLVMHDVSKNMPGVAKALLQFNLSHTLANLPGANDHQLACAAKLGDWSCVPSPEAESSFHLHHYLALKALHNSDMTCVAEEIGKATNIVLGNMAEKNMESPQNLYKSLSHLQCLKQLRDVSTMNSMADLLEKWEEQDLFKPSEFSLLTDIIEVRCVILKERNVNPNMLADQHLRICKLARRAKKHEIALRNIIQLSQLHNVNEKLTLQCLLEEARYYWDKGVYENATFLLSKLIQNPKAKEKPDFMSKLMRIYGEWMVERKAENPKNVIERYFKKSLQLARQPKNTFKAYAVMAKFADANYIQLQKYMNSVDYGNRTANLQHRATKLQKERFSTRVFFQTSKRENEIDYEEDHYLKEESKNFLFTAMRYYLLSLQECDKNDHFIFRYVSLWLANGDLVTEEDVALIPSHKFILLLPQIVPRMQSNSDNLYKTVERVLNEHPYHTLPHLFALKNALADSEDKTVNSRMRVAYNMLQEYLKRNPTHHREMEFFTFALINFANISAPKPNMTGKKIMIDSVDSISPILKVADLRTVLMPSENLPVSLSLQYNNVVGIAKFDDYYVHPGGINFPKKIGCLGTDGKRRSLLVKGNDDLRQDAVIQQVFSVINTLLAEDEETARHKLMMRTYRVMPLTKKSGIIEWCENTLPLGLYLVGNSNYVGAHPRFRPNDFTPQQADSMMNQPNQTPAEKLLTFNKICTSLRPVFHYFFLQNFPSAGMAFDRRLAYTRSVATSSMIGYILGLGDRHLNNILIDCNTAEVLHVDLGVAFESGRLQSVPETVPFRLTRDIVDGMGLTGVNGVFRPCCERTMDVMHRNKDIIITLLEVLLYDPLNTWIFKNKESFFNVSMDENKENVNARAERALSRVLLKLQGLDQGVVTSVQGQVNWLIQQAMDSSNLSKLYRGWKPYL